MLKEVRKIKALGKRKYIYAMLNNGKLKKYVYNGRLAYEEDELKEFKRNCKRGRPVKLEVNVNE